MNMSMGTEMRRATQSRTWRALLMVGVLMASALALVPVAADHDELTVYPDAMAGPTSQGLNHDFTVENPQTDSNDHDLSTIRFSVAASGATLDFNEAASGSKGSDGNAWGVETGTDDGRHWIQFSAPALAAALTPGESQEFTIAFHVTGSPAHGTRIPIDVEGRYLEAMAMDARVHVEIDAEAPRIQDAEALDQDSDGHFDAYNVSFTEPVQAASIVPDDWEVEGLNLSSIQTASQALVTSAMLTIQREPMPDPGNADTASPPALTYTGSNLTDAVGNVQTSTQAVPLLDRAPPVPVAGVLLDSDGDGHPDRIDVDFSEEVLGELRRQDWRVEDPLGDQPSSFLTRSAASRISLDVNDSTDRTDLMPWFEYTGKALRDSAGNAMPAFRTYALDGVQPQLVNATILDSDADGHVDAVAVEFSEGVTLMSPDDAMLPGPSSPAGGPPPQTGEPPFFGGFKQGTPSKAWSVENRVLTDWLGISGTPTWLLLLEPGELPDTASTPTVTFGEADVGPHDVEIHDLAGNTPLNAALTSLDGAGPVLLRTDGSIGNRQVTLWFSEPIFGSGTSNSVTLQDIHYDDASGDEASTVESIAGGSGTNRLELRLDTDLSQADAGTDILSVVDLQDAEGNAATGQATIAEDTNAPAGITDLGATPLTRTSIRIEWTTPPNYDASKIVARITNGTMDEGEEVTAGLPLAVPGAKQSATLGELEPDASYNVTLQVIDHAGNIGPASNKASVHTPLDTTPPTEQIVIESASHPVATRSYPDDAPSFSWNAVEDDESSVHYLVAITNTTQAIPASAANATEATTWSLDAWPDGTWYVQVRAASDGGASPQVASRKFVIDTTPPGQIDDFTTDALTTAVDLQWTAPGDDGIDGKASAYEVRLSIDPDTNASWGTGLEVEQALQPAAAGAAEHLTITGLVAETSYWVAVRAVDDAGNTAPVAEASFVTKDDLSAPEGSLNVTSTTHISGEPSDAYEARFNWTAATDAESQVRYHFAITNRSDYQVKSSDNVTSTQNFTVEDLQEGQWHVHVRARSAGGWGEQGGFSLVVLRLDEATLASTNAGIAVKATAVKGGILVLWRLPSSDGADVQGVQVWSVDDGLELLADVPSSSMEFEAGRMKLEGSESTQLAVTAYYGKTVGLGYFPSGSAPEVKAWDLVEVQSNVGSPWMWVAAAGLGALIVGVAVVLRLRRARSVDPFEELEAQLAAMERSDSGVDASRG